MVEQDLDGRSADEEALAGQQPVGDAAKPVEIDARVDRLPAERGFGRHVGRRSGDRAFGGDVVKVLDFGLVKCAWSMGDDDQSPT
ncbi:MAG TPA: hypothetical protein VJ648_03120 [Vicinamibacteria bacterium]|nr:hypothetical protein [Vicinamibacteria bacterium]